MTFGDQQPDDSRHLHRPSDSDQAAFAREANRLAALGLKAADVAGALGITPQAAEQLLASRIER